MPSLWSFLPAVSDAAAFKFGVHTRRTQRATDSASAISVLLESYTFCLPAPLRESVSLFSSSLSIIVRVSLSKEPLSRERREEDRGRYEMSMRASKLVVHESGGLGRKLDLNLAKERQIWWIPL